MTTDLTSEAKGTGAHLDVDGLRLSYEIHGTGRPLLLIHGGLGAGEMFGPVSAVPFMKDTPMYEL